MTTSLQTTAAPSHKERRQHESPNPPPGAPRSDTVAVGLVPGQEATGACGRRGPPHHGAGRLHVGATNTDGYRKRLATELERVANVFMVGTKRTSDFGEGDGEFERLLVDVRAAASSDAVVIASTMIPAQGDEVVSAMNRDYVARLERLAAADERISAGNFRDELHPNDKGYAFMADCWVEPIKVAEVLGLIKKPDEI
ncbi:uncharacterized protein PpBr36_09892 [Pyricularia pennisetigena]|uniref:uncharacterized protein n=1 Tax=Pyricularia pennisetigena TaxID=1578925 RepID=UPI001153C41E|nr:uncharacterized protein PpBr36_09892 [Pyricularia pennisetigena]TLS22545.1 hypothetical protein PpBr36_09892 [Pyricularia pennisetigena]